ncbi:MAG: response regulator transcription factor [Asgard group archaeon]|nr:response regulator transcription factor [Asgard group archaeon]
MQDIRVVIVEDHPLFRQGIVDLLSDNPKILIIAEADTGKKGLDIIRELQPEIAIVDVNLPILNGQQIIRQIQEERLSTKVILLTAYDDPGQIVHAMQAGASAYLSKEIQPQDLLKTIEQVSEGKYVLGEHTFNKTALIDWLSNQSEKGMRDFGEIRELSSPLSKREMEVLLYISQGKSNKEIAYALGISHQTVKNHVTAILRKLVVEDRTQAAIFAYRRGWIRNYQKSEE